MMYMTSFPIEEMEIMERAKGRPWPERMALYRHSIKPYATIPQVLANAWTDVMIEACRGFHEEDYMMPPALDYIDDLSDEMVDKRIDGYQLGYDKEWQRRSNLNAWEDISPGIPGGEPKLRYVFAYLPRPLQRSIVSNWDRIHHEWMAEHPLVCYMPDVGYFWVIDKCVIKMFEDVDGDTPPTEEECLNWEKMNAPGGLSGWVTIQATRDAGEIEPWYFGYGDFED